MNRRTVLAAVASGFSIIAGCSSLLPSLSGEASSGESQSVVTVNGCPLPDGMGIAQAVCDGEESGFEAYLYSRRATVSLPEGAIEFVLVNQTGGDILYSPCRWVVYKQTEQGWDTVRRLEGEESVDILRSVPAVLTLHVGQEPPAKAGNCAYSLGELDTGRYMFGVQGTIPELAENPGTTLFLAPFRAEN